MGGWVGGGMIWEAGLWVEWGGGGGGGALFV